MSPWTPIRVRLFPSFKSLTRAQSEARRAAESARSGAVACHVGGEHLVKISLSEFALALGCGRVGTNAVDVQLVECAPKLCVPGTGGRIGLIDPENAGFVAIERQRLA